MAFKGFETEDFYVFKIDGLDSRMEAIKERIQPKFKELGTELTDFLSMELGQEMHLHIARHARRSVNPPNDTWLAISENKRGYKKHPHFQVGLFDDRLFVWIAYIYELPNKRQIAEKFMERKDWVEELPDEFVFSMDHMKKTAFPLETLSDEELIRFRDVKKAELLLGRQFATDEEILTNGKELTEEIKNIFRKLLPLFKYSV